MQSRRSRRQILQTWGSVGLGWAVLPGCQSLDRLFLGEYREDAERVTIVGAGLAGLTAAFLLKKKQIPFQVFEASPRIGGRIFSAPEFLSGQPVAELGAEWFSGRHKFVLDLAKELRLEAFETKDLKAKFRRSDKFFSLSEYSKDLGRLQKGIRKDATEMSSVSLAEWARGQTQNTDLLDLINEWSLQRFGVESAKISAGPFAEELQGGTQALGPWLEQRYRLRNGMASLTESLFERVSGFQPERTFAFRHRLRSVRLLKRGYQLEFETPSGNVSVGARAVICAIPVSGIKGVDGVQDLPGPWTNPEEFVMGQHSKTLLAYSQRFWVPQLENTVLFLPGQQLWEPSYKQTPVFNFRQGILTSQFGGEAARKVGVETIDSLKLELQKTLKPQPGVQVLDEAIANWSVNGLFQGSVPPPYVGRRTQQWKSTIPGWHWAGDFVSERWRGTLNGAIESATAAVEAIAKAKTLR